MSSIADLLSRLRALDIRLTLDGDRLHISAPKGALTEALRAELAAGKEGLKAFLREAQSNTGSDAIEGVPRSADMPVSHTQQRMWFLKQMDPTSSAYNAANALVMKGIVDVKALEQTLQHLVTRHDSLRTRFVVIDGQPRCVIEREVRLQIDEIDLSHYPEGERDRRTTDIVIAAARKSFDVSVAPLMRVTLVRQRADLHVFCFVLDHIICDGLSLGILVHELQALYTQFTSGKTARLAELPVQYLDFVEWQRKRFAAGALEDHLAYWRGQLTPLPAPLQLPADRPRPKVQTSNGGRTQVKFPPELADSLKALARRENATLYMVLLAAFQTVLHRYTGEASIAVGSAIANRARPEVEWVVGFFANNIVLRTDLSRNPTVSELIARVREVALKGYAHQDMPFDVLVEALAPRRELDHSPLFQVMFVLHSLIMQRLDLPGVVCEPYEFQMGTARVDLSVDVFDIAAGLRMYFEYNSDLFDAATIDRLIEHFGMILAGFVANPGARIGDLSMMGSAERQQLTQDWNNTARAYPAELTVHSLFEAQVRRTPNAEAVRFAGHSLSYEELNQRANQLAHHLLATGAKRDGLIGVWIDRSLEMVVALLGVLKSGAAYVPLDPAFPQDRIDFMVQDAALTTLITNSRLASTLTGRDVRAICLDSDWTKIAQGSPLNPEAGSSPRDMAYVIYTSGSTGKPKGVQIEHRAVVNFLESMHREPGIGANDRVLSVTTLSFDIAGLEIFGPLTAGGAVIIADRATTLDGQKLMALLELSRATAMQATPATWRLLLESGWEGTAGLKILCGGEGLPRELANRLLQAGAEVWNLYGPTETTIWSTVARVVPGADHPNIGKPIANTQVYILDSERRAVPVGVPGELYIGGDGLARGYLNRPELTAERFVDDALSAQPGARMYRTGDLARWRPDGTLQCLGRADHQVKIRGYRIEPGEIEATLAKHPGIAQGVVIARADSSGEQRLLAYLVAQTGVALDPLDLRRFLAQTLPEYMIPSIFMAVEALPLTPNGKIDRQALPEPVSQSIAVSAGYSAPENETETAVAAIWQDVLKLAQVGRDDNFFDLGGHSLLVVQVQSRIQKQLNRSVSIVEFFQYPTVATLAARLASDTEDDGRMSLARERGARRKAALLNESAS